MPEKALAWFDCDQSLSGFGYNHKSHVPTLLLICTLLDIYTTELATMAFQYKSSYCTVLIFDCTLPPDFSWMNKIFTAKILQCSCLKNRTLPFRTYCTAKILQCSCLTNRTLPFQCLCLTNRTLPFRTLCDLYLLSVY